MRVYFFNAETGQELVNHPHNGKMFLSNGPAPMVAGRFDKRFRTDVEVCVPGKPNDRVILRASDFPVPVKVKLWAPGIAGRPSVEWFRLGEG